MAATKVRFHYPDGRVVVQQLTAFAKANAVQGRSGVQELLARWQREGKIKRRPDGGYDVIRRVAPKHPSPIRGGLGSLLGGDLGGLLSGE